MNPYASWNTAGGSNPPPSILGALPSLYAPPPAASAGGGVLSFHFTAFADSLLNCTVVGPQSRTFYRLVSDAAARPFCTVVREFEGGTVAVVEWAQHPNVEIRGHAPKQRVAAWLGLAADRRSRIMYVGNVGYCWAPNGQDICLVRTSTTTAPSMLAKLSKSHNLVTLEVSHEAMQLGLLEPCVVAGFLLLCGRNID